MSSPPSLTRTPLVDSARGRAGGSAGGGMYFAFSPRETEWKAECWKYEDDDDETILPNLCVLECLVWPGKSKKVNYHSHEAITFASLVQEVRLTYSNTAQARRAHARPHRISTCALTASCFTPLWGPSRYRLGTGLRLSPAGPQRPHPSPSPNPGRASTPSCSTATLVAGRKIQESLIPAMSSSSTRGIRSACSGWYSVTRCRGRAPDPHRER